MLYIHQATCISPQSSFDEPDLDHLHESVNNKLHAIEPSYPGIPPGIQRRMGRAVRMGVGAALSLLGEGPAPAGIIIGTANGGMEDCVRFLNQIIQYEEGLLTPGNFVQSTPNAIASQIGLLKKNKAYNITHVHRGLAFENALMDAQMIVQDQPKNHFLVGAVDEISDYNYNIDRLGGWYKRPVVSNNHLYATDSPGSIAGEGSTMFLVAARREYARAQVEAIQMLHTRDIGIVRKQGRDFLEKHVAFVKETDLLLTGENGDSRLLPFYQTIEALLPPEVTTARFKHMSGEYPTASAMALWLSIQLLDRPCLPVHMLKSGSHKNSYRKIMIYNNYKGAQHSFTLVSQVT